MQTDAAITHAVFAAFETPTKLARAIGEKVSTVHSWKRVGRIPRWRRDQIAEAARREAITLPVEFSPEPKPGEAA
jgi:hypothetical protein